MGIAAMSRAYAAGAPKGASRAAAGALFFMLSDTILAVNKFKMPLPFGHHTVLTTYYVAQYLIFSSVHPPPAKSA